MRLPSVGRFFRKGRVVDTDEAPEVAPQPRQSDEQIVAYVEARREDGRAAAQPVMGAVAVGIAFDEGRQWVDWSTDWGDGKGRLRDRRQGADWRWYRTANLAAGKIKVNTARVTSSRPEATILPRGDSELTMEAAEEARMVVDYYDEVNRGRDLLAREAHYCQVATTAFRWFWWDADADADVVEDGPNGPEIVRAAVGELRETTIWGHNVILDPQATGLHDARWVIVEQELGLGEIERRWGKRVNPDRSRADGLLDGNEIENLWAPGKTAGRSAVVSTFWERPTVDFPKGRTVIWSGSTLMRALDELPCGVVPLCALGYEDALDSPYHRNLMHRMAPIQLMINEVMSGWMHAWKRSTKLVVTRQTNDGAGSDLVKQFREGPDVIELFHRVDTPPPGFSPVPVPTGDSASIIQVLDGILSDIAGVHGVSEGGGEANANSGIAIRLLSDADRTMNALFEHNVERYIEDIARMRILFASHYVREKRAWGLDGSDNPTERLSGLEALRRGAGVVVRVVESSGTPRTPEVMDEQIMAFFDRGALGNPQDPAVRKLLFKALQSPAAVRVAEMLEQMEAEMPPPAPPGMEAPSPPMDEPMPPPAPPMAP
ncbi:MAG TPA: hypothetical protein PK308_10140, partial [Phycisphaerales bacterium]|nr:hypothetical protein [Phycisphaerales bacterium]